MKGIRSEIGKRQITSDIHHTSQDFADYSVPYVLSGSRNDASAASTGCLTHQI